MLLNGNSILSTIFAVVNEIARVYIESAKQNQIDPRGSKTKIKVLHNRLAKILSVLIPVCAFTVLLPLSEHQLEARETAQPAGMVLGAYTENIDVNNAQNNQPQADFNVAGDPEVRQIKFDPLSVSAKSVLAYDIESGKTLIDRNSSQKLAIASLTKLMTSIVAMEDPGFADAVVIGPADHTSIAPVLSIRNGDKVMPLDLVKSMLVGSANDAALTIGNHFPDKGTFVEKMNAKAKELGMSDTHFDNPVGFDSPDNYSTAADLQKLVEYALKVLPYDQIWQSANYSFKSVEGHVYSIRNSNDLVFKNNYIHSIKTGYTPAALENMIVEAENPEGKKIVALVLGSSDRDTNTKKVVDYIFQNFSWN